jgi:HPt (histidine-containing phosphotransfer) domain-containing protein
MSEYPPDRTPILSDFASDPDMRDLVEMFVMEMPQKVTVMESAMAESRWDILRRMAHQMKGAAGGYGFAVVSESAGHLEHQLLRTSAPADEQAIQAVRRQVDELVDLCRRVSSAA